MALLADGYHMASHAGALGISYLVYKLARSEKMKKKLSFGAGKFLPLGGYSSALLLGVVSVWMGVESIHRFLNPTQIHFSEAISIAFLGLIVNLVSAFILGFEHRHHDHDHDHHHVEDHNHKSALVHVLADALTSVLAIIALFAGRYYNAFWLDPLMGIVGAFVILKWAYGLLKETAWELLDAHPKLISQSKIQKAIEDSGKKVLDIHIWKIGPANHACQIVVSGGEKKGTDYYRKFLPNNTGPIHLVIEER
jgi:cation diffusion facilitator family transporter